MLNEVDQQIDDAVLGQIFQQILFISKGECHIDEEMLSQVKREGHFNILSGLQMLHEDLDLYKAELKAKMEAEFQLEVLKKRNEELAEFNYVASHDLQEPLHTILAFTGLLLKNNETGLNEESQFFLKHINESANRMSELIVSLLNYSLIGKIISFEVIDCNALMQQVLLDLDSSIQASAAIIQVESLPTVQGDKALLRQVFQNLISNALKFKQASKQAHLKISSKVVDNQCYLSFKDKGIGIEKQYLDKVFGIFQRLHNKTEYDGTGLGLATCRKIVEMHNGKIWAASEKGIETTFFVSLPNISNAPINNKLG